MPTPEFVTRLRRSIGHELLPMVGVTGVVLDADGRVLLGRRSDNGCWALPSGILEPGEHPAAALAREVLEETGVVASVDALVAVVAQPPMTHLNGDVAQYVDLCFRCSYVDGAAAVGDDESLEVGWFDVVALPEPMTQRSLDCLARDRGFTGTTWFEPAVPSGAGADTLAATLPLRTTASEEPVR